MTRLATLATLALGLLLAPPATADEEDAEVCLRTKVWEGYGEGWAIRTLTSTSLDDGATRNYLVTLYAGNEYLIQGCADSNSDNLDILLYDLDGRIVARDDSKSREPSFNFAPQDTTTYYVVLYAQDLVDGSKPTGAGLAVTYR